jgi:uncharacterized membrane protein
MTAAASKSRTLPLRAIAGTLVGVGLIGAAFAAGMVDLGRMAAADWTPRAPDVALIARQPLALQVHLGAALVALAIGLIIMARPKGRGLHRVLGWSWVIAMAITAVSSLFLTGLNGDRVSLIHLLSGWTIIMLPMAIVAIRRRNVDAHRRRMTGLFMGGLLIAGALTFLPGRLMWHVFFG